MLITFIENNWNRMYDYRERVNQVHCCVNNYVNCVDERVAITIIFGFDILYEEGGIILCIRQMKNVMKL